MKKSLFLDKEWEHKCIEKICTQIKDLKVFDFELDKIAILQLSYEYSGLMAQLMAHKLSETNEPLDIEPVNIPYKDEFETFIHPDQLDPYTKLIVVDSGCLSGNNFKKIEQKLCDYGFIKRQDIFFTCVACDLNSVFKPDFCPIYFNGDDTIIHFWWETKTNKFNR